MALTKLGQNELRSWLRDTGAYSWTLDADGRVGDCEFWPTLTGQSLVDAPTSWREALHPDDRERVRAAWNTAFVHGQPYNVDMRILCIDGIYRWFNVRASPTRLPDGRVAKWIGLTMGLNDPASTHRGSRGVASVADNPDTAAMPPAIARAARAMMDWSAEELSKRSGVSVSTIRRLERDDSAVSARRTSTAGLLRAYADAGLRFADDGTAINGVRWSRNRR